MTVNFSINRDSLCRHRSIEYERTEYSVDWNPEGMLGLNEVDSNAALTPSKMVS